jgi:tetratricopeptide (TPR) repeat protein
MSALLCATTPDLPPGFPGLTMPQLDTLLAEALSHHRAGRLAEAEAAYTDALALAPARAAIRHNLAVLAAERGDHADALTHLDAVIAAEPAYAAAHYNRGVALQKLGRMREAIAAMTTSVGLEPGNYDAHRALGFLRLAGGERDRALDHLARTYELRRGEDRDGSALASITHASRRKLVHDAAQLRHIAGVKRDGKRFELLARAYDMVARELPEERIVALSSEQLDMLGEDYNCAIHIAAAPAIDGPAVSPTLDRVRIGRDLAGETGQGGATFVDGLLTPPALARLRRYLLESTIWHDFSHIGGFVATYLEDGLACPLVLQIADELRAALPDVLGPYPLSQAWAFKGLEGSAAVAAHADDARWSVNLWLTPDAANLDPASGGLVVCRTPPPADWEIRGYDADAAEIDAFMARHAADSLAVPYGENRAVLFEARLFHRSDAPSFAPEYVNHRINLTLLYG